MDEATLEPLRAKLIEEAVALSDKGRITYDIDGQHVAYTQHRESLVRQIGELTDRIDDVAACECESSPPYPAVTVAVFSAAALLLSLSALISAACRFFR